MTTTAAEPTNSSHTTPTAVVYLRVSTKDQATRGGQSEGFSIPAQRQACTRKGEQLGATISSEFVDRGESAKTADRPGLQAMLIYLEQNPTSYVLVHKVDRLARNRTDDVTINVAIQGAGATLVSCTENIDETPSGALMHGIMSSIAEFYSRNLANEVVKGSTQKAMSGGTIGKAPTGYRNVRKIVDNREIRTVDIDPERGPLMQWAFEQYATGNWSIRNLLKELTHKGLTSTGGPNTPSKPLSLSNFNNLLKNDYYIGIVSYRGAKYPGNHEPLISRETFDQVQHQLTRNQTGERQRTHRHYLRSTLHCGHCNERLIVSVNTNRHGTTYPYYVCAGRHEKRNDCTFQAILITKTEDLVQQVIDQHSLTAEQRNDLQALLHDELSFFLKDNQKEQMRQTSRIQQLKDQRDKLLQAHYANASVSTNSPTNNNASPANSTLPRNF